MNLNKEKLLLKYLDNFLLMIWHIVSYTIKVLLRCTRSIFSMIKLCTAPLFNLQFLKPIAKFATYVANSKIVKALINSTASLGERCDNKMKSSKKFRRIVFPLTAVLLALYFYPPSHWGPWHKYQTGVASYYSSGFWFKKTSNGDTFIPLFYTAAHKTLPLGITAKVVNCENGKTVYVKINDRGPFVKGRILDLSSAAAKKIGIYNKGTGKVIIYTKKKYKK